jgi:FMN phosphatase YigB (HAD superfamily)
VPADREIVFLVDVDNTLLDNDRVTADLRRFLSAEMGDEREERYFAIFEELRADLGYADYLGALQRYRVQNPHDSHILKASSFLIDYPFANRLFPQSLDAVVWMRQRGRPVILTDGDAVFQQRKIERSGLLDEFEGHALVYIHKEDELRDVERRYPADHYVLVDDKLRLLTAIKAQWGHRVTTVFVRQGHYAVDPAVLARYPAADVTLERIGDVLTIELDLPP